MDKSIYWAVDWTSAGMAMKSISTKRQIWLCKHLTGNCAVGTVMVRRDERKHSECPRCGHLEEDVRHVVICRDQHAQTIWQAQLSNLRSWLQKRITHPKIVSTIMAGLRMWHRGACLLDPLDPKWHSKCLYAQNAIRWENFLQRRVSLEWADHHQQYYKHLDMRRTGRRWTIALIQKLWDVSWTMWDHRNHFLHEGDSNKVLGNSDLNESVMDEFRLGQLDVLPQFRYIMAVSLEEVKAYTASKKRRWLRSINVAREIGRRKRETRDPSQPTLDDLVIG